jgi:competence protein ComEA
MRSIQFSHIEKAGILLFSTIILAVIVFIELSSKPTENEKLITMETAFDSSDEAIPQKKRKPTKSIGSSKIKKVQHLTGEKFSFDPNTISKDSLIMLGLNRKSAGNLVKYREKGGKFRKKEDLLKIFGVDQQWFEEVEDFIDLSKIQKGHLSKQIERPPIEYSHKNVHVFSKPTYSKNSSIVIDINAASQEDFMQLKGVGSTLSGRIVKYRQALGGFYSTSQIGEVYGIKDSLFQTIQNQLFLDEVKLEDIAVNKLSVNELAKHPYIDFNFAKKIVNYREQHKGIKGPDALRKIYLIDRSIIDKVLPYLDFSE